MDENSKKEFQGMMVKFMEAALKHSKINVPQPLPVVESKAEQRLNTDDFIAWKQMIKEWVKLSDEGKKVVSKLLIVNSHDLIESLNIHKEIAEESKDTADFVRDHPEYGRPEDTDSDSIREDLQSLFDF